MPRRKGLRALGVRVPGPGKGLARDGRSLVRSDGRTEILPCVLQDIFPFRAAAQKGGRGAGGEAEGKQRRWRKQKKEEKKKREKGERAESQKGCRGGGGRKG